MSNAVVAQRQPLKTLWVIPAYVLLCLVLLPYFREIIDPDDTNYLAIAARYAAGDWRNAVNGMWSPLNSWLGAILLPTGIPAILLFKYLNIAIGIPVLLNVRALLSKSALAPKFHTAAMLGLLPFALYATYHELAADWLQCMLVLAYFNVVFSRHYLERPAYPLWCGLLGALAFYAKFYNFHFFWLHFLIANVFWCYKSGVAFDWKRFLRMSVSGLGVLVVAVIPWLLLLHAKYGFWKLNYTGAYDLSWSLEPELVAHHTRALLLPKHADAPSYLEDPIWLPHDRVTPFTNTHYLLRQIGTCALALLSLLESLSFFSVLLPAIIAFALFRFLRGGWRQASFLRSSMLAMIVLPLGYLLFHVEPRFIWPLFLLGYVLGWQLLVTHVFPRVTAKRVRIVIGGLFVLTCSLKPGFDIAKDFSRDDEVTRWAGALRPLHLSGSFITNGNQNTLVRLAYLSRMSLAIHKENVKPDELIASLTDRHVHYYLEFSNAPPLLPCDVTSQLAEISQGVIPNLRIYRLY